MGSKRSRELLIRSLLAISAFLYWWQNHVLAWGMHISEGILTPKWSGIWYALTLPILAICLLMLARLFKEDRSKVPLYGLIGALIFMISLLPIPVPISGTCSHPCGTPLGAIVAGPPASILMGAIALLFQALFFAHGGLSTWGANVFSMAIVGSLTGYMVHRAARRSGLDHFPSAFLAGFFGDLAVYLVTALQLSLSLEMEVGVWRGWGTLFIAFLPTQLPLAVLEGLVTAGIVIYVQRREPSLLRGKNASLLWGLGKEKGR